MQRDNFFKTGFKVEIRIFFTKRRRRRGRRRSGEGRSEGLGTVEGMISK